MIRLLSIQGLNRLLLWVINHGDPVKNAHRWIGLFVEDDSTIPDAYFKLYAARNELPDLQKSQLSLMAELGRFGRVRSLLDLREEVGEIAQPTSFIWGSEDYYWEPELGRSVANQMPDATFHELVDHGHTPWLEPSDEAETIVRSFLDDN